MTTNDNLELRLRAWMVSTAPEREPSGTVDRAMAATEHSRQQPRIFAAGLSQPRPGPATLSPAARFVLVVLVVAAAAAATAYVGSHLLHKPEPVPELEHRPRFIPVSGVPDARQWLGVLADGRVLIAPAPRTTIDPGDGRASLWDPASGTLTPTGKTKVPDRNIFPFGVTLEDGRLLLAGGDYDEGSPVYPTAEVYDPKTGTFTSLGRMLDPEFGAAVVRLADGRVLITGGIAEPGNPPIQPIAGSEIFDPRTNTFARTGGLISPRAFPDVVALADGRVLVVGGQLAGPSGFLPNDDSPETGSAEIYDPPTDRFTAAGSLPEFPDDTKGYRYPLGWWGPLVALPDGRALVVGLRCQEVHDVVGGVSAGVSKTPSYFYDPRTGAFSRGPVLPHCVERAFTLADGRVFVVGWWYESADTVPESDGTIVLSGKQVRWSAVLDPTTGTLTDAGRPPDNVEYVYAQWLPLPDGRILVSSAYDHQTFVLANSP